MGQSIQSKYVGLKGGPQMLQPHNDGLAYRPWPNPVFKVQTARISSWAYLTDLSCSMYVPPRTTFFQPRIGPCPWAHKLRSFIGLGPTKVSSTCQCISIKLGTLKAQCPKYMGQNAAAHNVLAALNGSNYGVWPNQCFNVHDRRIVELGLRMMPKIQGRKACSCTGMGSSYTWLGPTSCSKEK